MWGDMGNLLQIYIGTLIPLYLQILYIYFSLQVYRRECSCHCACVCVAHEETRCCRNAQSVDPYVHVACPYCNLLPQLHLCFQFTCLFGFPMSVSNVHLTWTVLTAHAGGSTPDFIRLTSGCTIVRDRSCSAINNNIRTFWLHTRLHIILFQ